VHEVLDLRGPGAGPQRLQPGPALHYKLAAIGARRRLGLLTGDLRYVSEPIDIWVNSENTNMQMARFFDKSGSAVIRYFGAQRDVAGQVVEDTIAEELARAMGTHRSVPPGTVIVTGAGALQASHGVKRLFHVAAVEGALGIGYAPVKDVAACVDNALARADAADLDDLKPRSILLPLLGTGSGGAELDAAIGVLLDATIAYFRRAAKSRLTTVYFQVFTDQQLETCHRTLGQRGASAVQP
jgi:O-acetyl-ADP-ribose deacetylase (regulator of RNase III)